MSTRFLPVREAVLDDWLANFSAKISDSPATYGLSADEAAQIAAAVASWHIAFEIAFAPATRTISTVCTKRQEKRAVTAIVRRFAALIRADQTISAELKIGLGLVLRNMNPARVNPPASEPSLNVRHIRTGEHTLQATDNEASGRGKPRHAAGLVVFRFVGDAGVSRPDKATYLGLFTRTTFASAFTSADRGKFATYFARWVNAKGEAGPWSKAISAAIAA